MACRVANSGHDENGRWWGGRAGDQDGTEWWVINWYSFGQTIVLRHPNRRVQEEIAYQAEGAAGNDLIGYDQEGRLSFWRALSAAGYQTRAITTPCEADCSAGVLAICKAVGYILGDEKLKDIDYTGYTGNERYILQQAGFEVLTGSKWTSSGNYLLRGDINLHERNHTNIVVQSGPYATPTPWQPDTEPENNNGLWYRAHTQNLGWLPAVHDGMTAGTTGSSLRMEAFKIAPPEGLEIDVTVHVQNKGDIVYKGVKTGDNSGEGSSTSDPIMGTTGQSLRLEGFSIRCAKNTTGKKLMYRAHVQNEGWQEWKSEGEFAGTRGKRRRMEAIQIKLV